MKDHHAARAVMETLPPQDAPGTQPGLIPLMREAVTERVERTSLRTAAREIGMSPSGLKKFLDGNMPYTKTIHRLRRWYLQHAASGRDRGEELSADEAYAALSVLVHDLSPGVRALTIEAMVESVEQGYAHSNRAVPAWPADIRNRVGR